MMDLFIEFILYQPWWAIYIIIFAVLLACGLGLPIPEDIILFTMGYFAYNGLADLRIGIAVCMLGVLIGDSTIYLLGAVVGRRLTRQPIFSALLPPERLERTKGLFHRWGNKLIFLARFMPGLRAPIYFSAGTLHLPFRVFLFYDFVAAMISVPLLTYAMYRFGGHVDRVIAAAHRVQGGIAGLIGLIVALLIAKHFWGKRKRIV